MTLLFLCQMGQSRVFGGLPGLGQTDNALGNAVGPHANMILCCSHSLLGTDASRMAARSFSLNRFRNATSVDVADRHGPYSLIPSRVDRVATIHELRRISLPRHIPGDQRRSLTQSFPGSSFLYPRYNKMFPCFYVILLFIYYVFAFFYCH